MRTKFKILIIVQLCFVWSCGVQPRIYTSGSYGTIKSYKEKPHYNGKKESAVYVSGDFASGKHTQFTGITDDKKTITSFSAHRSVTNNNYNLYYGLGGSFGKYTFTDAYEDNIVHNDSKNFYSLNVNTGLNYTMSRRIIDYRFIGIELGYNHEFGPYQNKLDELKDLNDSGLIIVNQKSLFSYNFYSEYVFKLSKDNALSVGFYIGDLINNSNYDNKENRGGFNGLTFSLRLNRYIISAVTQRGDGGIKSTKVGLTYKLF